MASPGRSFGEDQLAVARRAQYVLAALVLDPHLALVAEEFPAGERDARLLSGISAVVPVRQGGGNGGFGGLHDRIALKIRMIRIRS